MWEHWLKYGSTGYRSFVGWRLLSLAGNRSCSCSTSGNHPRLCMCSFSFPWKQGDYEEPFLHWETKGSQMDCAGSATECDEGLAWEFRYCILNTKIIDNTMVNKSSWHPTQVFLIFLFEAHQDPESLSGRRWYGMSVSFPWTKARQGPGTTSESQIYSEIPQALPFVSYIPFTPGFGRYTVNCFLIKDRISHKNEVDLRIKSLVWFCKRSSQFCDAKMACQHCGKLLFITSSSFLFSTRGICFLVLLLLGLAMWLVCYIEYIMSL